MSKIKFELILNELNWQFSKSSGPGGQHVNTTDSKAKLIWDFRKSPLLNTYQKNLIKKNLKNYLTKSSCLLQISSSKNRNKEANRKDCIQKLSFLVKEKAFFEPKKRRPTKPTKGSIERRLESKRRKSTNKQNRKKVDY